MENINEALLIYVHVNQQMPATLDDLRSVSGPDLVLVSPTGKPYGYVPSGLVIPNSPKRLIVYDPDELPNNRRWCILITEFRTGAALVSEVTDLPEGVFRAYLASGQ